ncbi:phospholipase D-like domain-containing protein [Paenibacillus lutimineralis]|uniref:Phosphatidylserine/phosphatidylglycerophosphate/ cardiolipin synthase family protein n=1 Tax=Paenibacillus lutimineralis TaxID=2707005 RepID=A0A3S9V394_9BACL|nr:phosphatidylserine/phosphatidylglycerophosphate/cardiolipin synthase family protein [Paenibacillus lutimineralis]AZS17075.1 phosphatidylserine/phosphatidylglycerophosphate/cardiolipin synthase family protein [Paenibacillus lutimineralis]
MKKKTWQRRTLKYGLIGLALYLFYIAAFGLIPYASFSEVNQQFKDSFDPTSFYGSEVPSVDRAGIMEMGEAGLEARIGMIHAAQSSLDVSYYSTHWGDSTQVFFGALLDAANRGVKVRFLIDGVAHHLTRQAKTTAYALVQNPNVELKFYNPVQLLKPWTFNGRLHDKYIIVDDKFVLLGGRNIGDKYFETEGYNRSYSLDRDVLVYNTASGTSNSAQSVIPQVKQYFEEIWGLNTSKHTYGKFSAVQTAAGLTQTERLVETYQHFIDNKPYLVSEHINAEKITVPTAKISFIHNPSHTQKKEPLLWYQLSELMLNADHKVTIQSPYTVLNRPMENTLRQVGDKLEQFSLLTNSQASSPNVLAYSSYLASRTVLADTFDEIYEYQGDHSLHGKSYLIDDDLSLVGSYNLDLRSTYINTEVMLVIHGRQFHDRLEDHMSTYQTASLVYDKKNGYSENPQISPRDIPWYNKWISYPLQKISWLYKFLL